VRFKLDQNLPLALVPLLSSAGHDAHTTKEEGLDGAGDPLIAAACLSEQRALLTFDVDFADIRAYPPEDYHGLLVLRLSNQAIPHVLAVVTHLLPLLKSEPVSGHLWVVEDTQVRIR